MKVKDAAECSARLRSIHRPPTNRVLQFMALATTTRPSSPDASIGHDDERSLLEQAGALRRAFVDGRPMQLLRGRYIGLLCADAGAPQARLFCQAAGDLGAKVAHIPADMLAASAERELASTARMLARLYDAVECQGLAPGFAQRLAAVAGPMVCDDLATDPELIDRLVVQLGERPTSSDDRRFVVQAVLLHRLT
jgi:ornithine carbamoyltransferase